VLVGRVVTATMALLVLILLFVLLHLLAAAAHHSTHRPDLVALLVLAEVLV